VGWHEGAFKPKYAYTFTNKTHVCVEEQPLAEAAVAVAVAVPVPVLLPGAAQTKELCEGDVHGQHDSRLTEGPCERGKRIEQAEYSQKECANCDASDCESVTCAVSSTEGWLNRAMDVKPIKIHAQI
jgi:hypothetical protein